MVPSEMVPTERLLTEPYEAAGYRGMCGFGTEPDTGCAGVLLVDMGEVARDS